MSRVVDRWHRKDRTRTARYGQGKRWQAVWTDGAGGVRKSSHATKDAAQAWLRDMDARNTTGTIVDRDRTRTSVAAAGERWLASRIAVHPNTLAEDRRVWTVDVLPMWGDRAVGSLRREELQDWVNTLAGRFAARTVDTRVRRLTAFLNWCVRERYIPASPGEGLTLPRGNKREHTYLTPGEFWELHAAVPPFWQDAVLVAATTGIRPGELWELRAGDVQVGRSRIRVARSVSTKDKGVVVGPTKTGGPREVPVPPRVMDLVAARVAGARRDQLVFPGVKGATVRANNFNRRVWRPAVEATGLPQDLRFYDLRHTAASWAVRSGASVLTVQRMLGHAKPSITLNVYAGLFDDELDDVAGRVGLHVFGPGSAPVRVGAA